MNNNNIKEAVKAVVDKYKTANPFVIADKLNIDVEWTSLFGKRPLAKTNYDDDAPIVMMNERIRYDSSRYYIMAHEIGHVIFHEGLSGYYTGIRFGHSKLEHESDVFAIALMGMLYIEENDRAPETIRELEVTYGLPVD